MAETFLYLTTIGRKSGQPREIEIWYVSHDGRHYLVAEGRENAHWVQNIIQNPAVQFYIGAGWGSGTPAPATARTIDPQAEPELARAVSDLMDAKYNWSDGLIVEIAPEAAATAPPDPTPG
ncbi:MAG: hypothetical protein OHK0046_15560 [Anaerolineae bacterium]